MFPKLRWPLQLSPWEGAGPHSEEKNERDTRRGESLLMSHCCLFPGDPTMPLPHSVRAAETAYQGRPKYYS